MGSMKKSSALELRPSFSGPKYLGLECNVYFASPQGVKLTPSGPQRETLTNKSNVYSIDRPFEATRGCSDILVMHIVSKLQINYNETEVYRISAIQSDAGLLRYPGDTFRARTAKYYYAELVSMRHQHGHWLCWT